MKNFNILIIEDVVFVAMEMKQAIEAMGFCVLDYATTSVMAKEILEQHNVHLIIMDINLGEDRDGIDIYESWGIDTPIIYLTAYNDKKTMDKAISTKPYAYLVKPYKKEELYAVIKLVYFKVHPQKNTSEKNTLEKKPLKQELYHLDAEYAFDLISSQLFYNTINIHLTEKESQLLRLLIEHDGEALSFETIEAVIWENEPTSNNTIRTLIYRLRGKINANLIEKVFGYGIRLVGDSI